MGLDVGFDLTTFMIEIPKKALAYPTHVSRSPCVEQSGTRNSYRVIPYWLCCGVKLRDRRGISGVTRDNLTKKNVTPFNKVSGVQ